MCLVCVFVLLFADYMFHGLFEFLLKSVVFRACLFIVVLVIVAVFVFVWCVAYRCNFLVFITV